MYERMETAHERIGLLLKTQGRLAEMDYRTGLENQRLAEMSPKGSNPLPSSIKK